MASKSVIGPASSKGLERNIVCVSVCSLVGAAVTAAVSASGLGPIVRPSLRLFGARSGWLFVHVEHWPHAEEVATGCERILIQIRLTRSVLLSDGPDEAKS